MDLDVHESGALEFEGLESGGLDSSYRFWIWMSTCLSWGSRVWTGLESGLESGALESGGLESRSLESGGLESRATDFGSGDALTCLGV